MDGSPLFYDTKTGIDRGQLLATAGIPIKGLLFQWTWSRSRSLSLQTRA